MLQFGRGGTGERLGWWTGSRKKQSESSLLSSILMAIFFHTWAYSVISSQIHPDNLKESSEKLIFTSYSTLPQHS